VAVARSLRSWTLVVAVVAAMTVPAPYMIAALVIMAIAATPIRRVVGGIPSAGDLRGALGLVFPLIVVSVSTIWSTHALLAVAYPAALGWFGGGAQGLEYDGTLGGALLLLVVVAGIVPIVEELIFRGVMVGATNRTDRRINVLLSSTIFGLGHADPIGAGFFGFAMAVLYLRTRSLLAPIAVHATNNAIVCAIVIGAGVSEVPAMDSETIAMMRDGWWIGVIALLAVAPWTVRFVRTSWPLVKHASTCA
jgi:uncharacterized protein